MYTTLISAEQLLALQTQGQSLLVFDCSFELMQPNAGNAQYQEAHIPGAVRADLEQHLSAKGDPKTASGGRHPLPSRQGFAQWLGQVGLSPDMQVVVYDRQAGHYSGRLWWMLKWLGHEASAVLDGGLSAWLAAGGATDSGPGAALSTSYYPPQPEKARLLSADAVTQLLGRPSLTVIDARAGARFRGEIEPLDPVAGHIPGALNRPFTENFDAQGKFKKPEQLRAEFLSLLAGREPASVVHHCGSGVTAVPNLIAMELAGLGRQALFAGSWSEWCSDPKRPCAQG